MANPSGEFAPDVGWTIIAGPPVPDSTGWGRAVADGVDSTPGYFITSWSPVPCKRSQTIDLLAKGATAAELDAAPEIEVEEWFNYYPNVVGTGVPPPDTYYIKVELRGASNNVIATWNVGTEAARKTAASGWVKESHKFIGYGPGVRYVYFEDGGADAGGWLGQYGSYHDGASVKFSLDTDGDGIPDAVEDTYAFMDKDDPADADEDGDNDGILNYDEYVAGLDMGDADTDNDGLEDGEEPELGTNYLKPDTDADGLLDGDEVDDYETNPVLADTDSDFFPDGEEVTKGSDPKSASSTPGGFLITSIAGPLGNDLTDPDGNGNPGTAAGTNFNWSFISTSHANMGTFLGTANEGAYSVFDNLTPGLAGSKWCCPTITPTTPHNITVGFNTVTNTNVLTNLKYFTITSGNDAAERQPRTWAIQGSNDNTTFTDIVRFDSPKSFWSTNLQTLRFELPKASYPYKYYRFIVFAVNAGTGMQIDEIEYFGEQSSADGDGDGIPKLVEDYYDFLDDAVAGDGALDQDSDGLSNAGEWAAGSNMLVTDTDGDGLSDSQDVAAGASPIKADTDGDGLNDYVEVNTHNTNPALADSDSDYYSDGEEIARGTNPKSAASIPGGVTVQLISGLLSSDMTDPDNNITDATAAGTNFNWSTITSSGTTSFVGEGASSVFDNRAPGTTGSKWCCPVFPVAAGFHHVTVGFNTVTNTDVLTSLKYFTVTSGGDVFESRAPRVWEIQGSMNGTTFETIARFDSPKGPWTANSQTLRFDLPKASLPYRYLRFAVFAVNAGTQFQIDEIEYFGEQTNADADGDGIPKLVEDYYSAFLSDANPDDADADRDSDGATNSEEYFAGTKLEVADSDGDGMLDGDEINEGTLPLVTDTDGDGLTDGNEFNTLHSDPKMMDTDGDGFGDGYEVSKTSDPVIAASTPGGVVVTTLGTGTGSLIGSDATDRENNLNDATAAGTGFDWVSSASTGANTFATEAALNVFDNKVGGGEAKWCCIAPTATTPQSLTVQLPYPIALTHFTLTSGDDAPDRDPRVWAIQGSNDGTNFTDIFLQEDNKMSFWGTSRLTVKKFQLPTAAPMYKWFRYIVRSTQPNGTAQPNGAMHQISEIEIFGNETDTDNDGIPDYWEAKYPGILDPAVADATGDLDSDGLSALQEYQNRTRLDLADSDEDGINDGTEVTNGTNPLDMKLLSFTRTGTNLQFSVKVSDFTKRYKLRRSTTLLPGDWIDVGAVLNPITDTLNFTDTTTANPKAMYIIETVP